MLLHYRKVLKYLYFHIHDVQLIQTNPNYVEKFTKNKWSVLVSSKKYVMILMPQ